MTTHIQGATTGTRDPVTPGEIPRAGTCVESVTTPGARSTDAAKHEQRTNALKRANEVRAVRAEIKKELATNGVWLAAMLVDWPNSYEKGMRVVDVLRAIPRFGPVKVCGILRRTGVSTTATLGSLTDRQRDALMAELRRTS